MKKKSELCVKWERVVIAGNLNGTWYNEALFHQTVLFSYENTPQVSVENRTKMSSSSQLVNIAVDDGVDSDGPYSVFTLGFYSLSKDFEGLWSCEVFHPSGISLNKDTLFLEIYGNNLLGVFWGGW